MLTGYKTYILTALGAIVAILMTFGYIGFDHGMLVLSFLGFGSMAALRAALKTEVIDLAMRTGLPLPSQGL